MFDSEFSEADDATVVAAIEEGARAEAAAGARRLAAIAELARRRVDDDDERANWAFEPKSTARQTKLPIRSPSKGTSRISLMMRMQAIRGMFDRVYAGM